MSNFHKRSKSVPKSSWTHLPDVKALRSTVRILDPIRELLLKVSLLNELQGHDSTLT